jgi:hypothetical protein
MVVEKLPVQEIWHMLIQMHGLPHIAPLQQELHLWLG